MSGVDLTRLPLSPLEGFVLSRIDGAASLADLADLTSLEEGQVDEIVGKLIEIGAVEWARESVSLPKATGRIATRTPTSPLTVPEDLRQSRPASSRHRGRLRVVKPPQRPSQSGYRAVGGEERVEPRRSGYPSRAPRASHTGSMFPPGEIDDDVGSEALRAPKVPSVPKPGAGAAPPDASPSDPGELVDELGALLEQAQALATPPPSGESGFVPSGTGDAAEPAPDAPTADEAPPPPSVGDEGAGSDGGAAASEPAASEPSASEAAASEASASEPAAETESRRPGLRDSGDAFDPRDFAPSEPPPAEPDDAAASEGAAGDAEDEDLDLPAERRKRIDDLYVALDLLDHYRVLGVEREAPRKDIRAAYFSLSKVFHPDTMFRKRLGSYKAKMEAIFTRLTEAYEVLGKKRPRAEYDRYLATQDKTRAVEKSLAADASEAQEAIEKEQRALEAARAEIGIATGEGAPAADAPTASAEPSEPSASEPSASEPSASEPSEPSSEPAPRRSMSAEAIERKKRLMAQKLRSAARAAGNTGKMPAAPRPEPEPEGPRPKVGRDQVLRDLASSLKSSASMTGGLDRVRRYEMQAARAEKDGDLAEAAQLMRLAMSVAPEREDLKLEHDRLNTAVTRSLADSYEVQARYEQEHKKWGAAALSWSKVVSGRPDDPEAHRRAAEALLKAKGDLHKARNFARRALDLEPDDIDVMCLLARVYIEANLPLNARRVLERAAKLDPEHQIVENLLRDLDS